MSNNRLTFAGLDELRAELRDLPEALRTEGALIVDRAAANAGQDIRAEYQARRVTGNLAEHVVVQTGLGGSMGARAVVKSTAKHAYIFENGTVARHYYTKKNGTRHETGAAPPQHVFVPAIMRARRAMYEALKDLLTRKGLKVAA